MPAEARIASKGWSGRRGSNPRPTAWKAVTLPLSYSRLRASPASPLGASAGKPASIPLVSCSPFGSLRSLRALDITERGLPRASPCGESSGGEGRIRTFEAAGATDLQSVAFDRFATSPISTGGRAGANALFFFDLSRLYSGLAPCATTVPSLVLSSVLGFRSCSGLALGRKLGAGEGI